MLPGMFAHLAQLMGIRGLEEYSPQPAQAATNLTAGAALQQGVDPSTGLPLNPAERGVQ